MDLRIIERSRLWGLRQVELRRSRDVKLAAETVMLNKRHEELQLTEKSYDQSSSQAAMNASDSHMPPTPRSYTTM